MSNDTANNFTTILSKAPIYTSMVTSVPTQTLGIHKNDTSDSSNDQVVSPQWQKWFQQITDLLNSLEYYGNPSLALNSDFYWNRNITSPVTQAAGDGAFFTETWQVHGATVATYTLTQTTYVANDPNQNGSTTYINVVVSAYTSGDFYFYQQKTGAEYLRLYQGRNLCFSLSLVNNASTAVTLQMEIFIATNPTGPVGIIYKQTVATFNTGLTQASSFIQIPLLTNATITGIPYAQFRLRFISAGASNFNLQYLKVEMADAPTPLYVDHALEEVRIDNAVPGGSGYLRLL